MNVSGREDGVAEKKKRESTRDGLTDDITEKK